MPRVYMRRKNRVELLQIYRKKVSPPIPSPEQCLSPEDTSPTPPTDVRTLTKRTHTTKQKFRARWVWVKAQTAEDMPQDPTLADIPDLGFPKRATRSQQHFGLDSNAQQLPDLPGLFKAPNAEVQFSRDYLKWLLMPGLLDVAK